jgi:acyl-ACP thioesterase
MFGPVPPPDTLPPLPDLGRRFRATAIVRLADVTRTGRLRLDAIARHLQDIATDDVVDAGLDEPAWVVRRTLIRVARFPRYREPLSLTTFCWSMGSRFAERRTELAGDDGGLVDTLTLWVRMDPNTGRPIALTDAFRELYRDAVHGRVTDQRLRHDPPPAGLELEPWPLRACDLDRHDHVNNAAYWQVLEQQLAEFDDERVPLDFEMEFRAPIPRGARVGVARTTDPGGARLWLVDGERTFASAICWPRDGAPDPA